MQSVVETVNVDTSTWRNNSLVRNTLFRRDISVDCNISAEQNLKMSLGQNISKWNEEIILSTTKSQFFLIRRKTIHRARIELKHAVFSLSEMF